MESHRGEKPVENTRGCEENPSESQHIEERSHGLQHQGERLSADCSGAVRGRCVDDPIFRITRGVRPGRCGECVMKATLIVIENDADHAEAKALVGKLMASNDPADVARMTA